MMMMTKQIKSCFLIENTKHIDFHIVMVEYIEYNYMGIILPLFLARFLQYRVTQDHAISSL